MNTETTSANGFSRRTPGKYRELILLLFAALVYLLHVILCPFPKRDPLLYLHILHEWNVTGSYEQMIGHFSKFGLLLFSFLPLKWADACGIPLYPASVAWMFFLSMVSVWAFYRIVLLLTGEPARAAWCALLLAVQPMFLLHAGNLYRDTPYMTSCLLCVLCLILSMQRKKKIFSLLAGGALSMALLCRYEALEMLVLFPLFALFFMHRKKFTFRETVSFILLSLLGFLAVPAVLFFLAGSPAVLLEKYIGMVVSYLPPWLRF